MHETRGHVRVNFLAADGACAEEGDLTPAPTPDDGALEPQSKKKSSTGPDTALVAGVAVAASVALLALGVAGAYLYRRRGAAGPDELAVKGESIEEESKEQPATD